MRISAESAPSKSVRDYSTLMVDAGSTFDMKRLGISISNRITISETASAASMPAQSICTGTKDRKYLCGSSLSRCVES